MSRIAPIPALPDIAYFDEEVRRRDRQKATDSAIAQQRSMTPPSATEMRQTRRLSIEELNDLDEDSIRSKLASANFDDRPTAIKVLDWIDLPRNTIANIAFGKPTAKGVAGSYVPAAGLGATAGLLVGGPVGAAIGAGVGAGLNLAGQAAGAVARQFTDESDREKAMEKSTLAGAGQQSVQTADALRAMGVSNRVVRAVVGFAGDVAFDPLTYVGPAGWGAKTTAKTARGAVEIGLKSGYRRAISGGSKALASGGQVLDPTAKAAFEAAGYTTEWAAAQRAAGRSADDIAAEMSGGMLGKVSGGKLQRGMEIFGADKPHTESFVGRHFFDYLYDDDTAKALTGIGAKDVAERGVKGEAARGLVRKFGKSGIEAAHIPFTDIALRFGKETLGEGGRAARLAKIGGAVGAAPDMVELLKEGGEIVRIADGLAKGTGPFDVATSRLEELAKSVRQRADVVRSNPSLNNAIVAAKAMDVAKAAQKRTKALLNVAAPDDLDGMIDANHAAISAAKELADATESSVVQFANAKEKAIIDVVQSALGTTDATIGVSALRRTADAIRSAFPDNQTADAVATGMDKMRGGLQRTFGRRTGEMHQRGRVFERAMREGADYEFVQAANEVASDVSKALKAAGRNPEDATVLDDALNVMYAMAVRARGSGDGLFAAKPWTEKGPVEAADLLANPSAFPDADENFMVSFLRAQKSGLLQDQKLTAELEKIAQKYVGVFDELGDVAQEMGLIGRPIMGYVANVPTPEFTKLAQSSRTLAGEGGGGGDALRASEAFQRPRSTDQYRFQNANGEWRRFFEYERAMFANMTPREIEAIRASRGDKAADRVIALKSAFKEYTDLGDAAPKPLRTDAIELNAMARSGRLGFLTQGEELPHGAFSTNLATIIGARTAMHQRAAARKYFQEAVIDNGLWVDQDLLIRIAQNRYKPITLSNGAEVKVGPTIDGQPSVEIGGQHFRMLDRKKISKGNPILEMDSDGTKLRGLFHEDVAREIERAAEVYSPENRNAMLRAYDSLQSAWKTITLTHPSWVIQDMFGMANQWAMGNVRMDQAVRDFPGVARLVWNQHLPDAVRAMTFTLPDGRSINGEELLRMAARDGVVNVSQALETGAQLTQRDIAGFIQTRADQARGPLKTAAAAAATPFTIVPESVAEMARGGIKAGATKFKDRAMRNFIGPWFRLNHKANEAMRLTAYLNYLGQGNDFEQAGALVRKHMFDFQDLTRTESRVARRLVPFYSWIKTNTIYQMSRFLQNPGVLATYPKLSRAVEEFINGDSRVPDSHRPAWLRDQLALQIGKDPDNSFALTLRSSIPVGDAIEALAPITGLEGAMDMMNYFGSGVSPIIKAPAEVAFGRELFSKREIASDPTRGDIGLVEYGLSQARPFREFGVGSSRKAPLEKAFEQGVGPGVARVLIGGRAQPFDEERRNISLLRQYQDRERGLRSAINRAERDGKRELSLDARAQLMSLYRKMLEVGLGDEVPVWAREQLEVLSG